MPDESLVDYILENRRCFKCGKVLEVARPLKMAVPAKEIACSGCVFKKKV